MLNWQIGLSLLGNAVLMRMKNSFLLLLLAACLSLMAAHSIQAGVPGYAEISNPQPDQTLAGLITIAGTADHPDFSSYELQFSYDPNPSDSWFPLTERTETPVQQSALGLWETGSITPGTYQLRLLVHTQSGQTLEATVANLHVGLTAAEGEVSAPSQPESFQAASDSDSAAVAAEQAVPEAAPAQPLTPNQILWRLVSLGALVAAALMLLFGGYSWLRPRLREYLGLVKMRRLHQQQRQAERQFRRDQ
jgi:hypothetical protein